MQHLDDGKLAEILDGHDGRTVGRSDGHEHLAECAECQARLEAMRVIRERAHAILRVGTPSGAKPAFADIVARNRAAHAVPARFRQPQVRSLAWAATVVLALSVGWYARELQLRPSSREQATLVDSRLDVDTTARSFARAPETAPPARPAGSRGDRNVGGRANDRLAEADESRAKAVDLAANQLKREEPPAEPALGNVTAPIKEAVEPPVVAAAGETQPVAVAQATTKKDPANVQEAPAPVSLAVERKLSLDAVIVSGVRGAGLEQATQTLGRRPLTTPGLEVIDYQVGEAPGSVRVRQRMGTGILEIHQQRAGTPEVSGPSASRALTGPGVGGLVEGIQVRLWGPVSFDSLRALVGRLR